MLPPDDFDPPLGVAEMLEPGLRRIVAPNPSPMTYRGTNTYLVGHRDLTVIDPGPTDDTHMAAILAAIGPDQRLAQIVVTHAHVDHSPLARPLAAAVPGDVPIYAFGKARDGMSDVMRDLHDAGMAGGGEGVDQDFYPDIAVKDGDVIEGGDIPLRVLHTPGHIGNHICLAWENRCFSADHVMGWASSLVSPPDGDLTDFMTSCARLQQEEWHVFYPGHGAPVHDPHARLDWLVTHRLGREGEILAALTKGPATAAELARTIYTETPAALLGAAARNVFAHLIDLKGKGRVETLGDLHQNAQFRLKRR